MYFLLHIILQNESMLQTKVSCIEMAYNTETLTRVLDALNQHAQRMIHQYFVRNLSFGTTSGGEHGYSYIIGQVTITFLSLGMKSDILKKGNRC